MNKLIILLCGVLLVPMHVQAADVYKWKDADGKVRYSDTPPGGKTPYELFSGRKAAAPREPDAAEAPASAPAADKPGKSSADKELDAKKRKAEAESLQKKEQEKQDQKRQREENCATAKQNIQNYKLGGRMFKIDEKGERQFLEDKDIAAGLEKANQEVERWCSGL